MAPTMAPEAVAATYQTWRISVIENSTPNADMVAIKAVICALLKEAKRLVLGPEVRFEARFIIRTILVQFGIDQVTVLI